MDSHTPSGKPRKSSTAAARRASQLPIGIAIGLAVGVALGIVMDNVALGMAVGLAIGCGWAVSAATLSRFSAHDHHRPQRRFEDRL